MQAPPPCYKSTFMTTLADALAQLARLANDDTATKEDVIASMRTYHAVLLRKALSTPTNTSFCIYHTPLDPA